MDFNKAITTTNKEAKKTTIAHLVALVVVGADGLWVVVDHDGSVAHGSHLTHRTHRAPVELHLQYAKDNQREK